MSCCDLARHGHRDGCPGAADELAAIVTEWGEFARQKCYVFRAVTPEAFDLYWPDFASAVISRSKVEVSRSNDEVVAWSIVERVPDSEAVIVHCCYTARHMRNQGVMRELLADQGITKDSKVFVSLLTVLAEKMIAKYGFLYAPFALFKGVAK